MRARIAVATAGALGLLVLARTAAFYQREDRLALGLVAMMALAFTVGLAELFLRASRASRLMRELEALPSPATASSVEGASVPLRNLLRARLAQTAAPSPGASLAPFLVGLLVMLGLLGTFLGLFETLRGAREALTTSGDIDALRASLALPMQGLMRSFGTSAAGVSTSAMLGLAAALARGSEARFSQALNAYAAGALAPLTVGQRQLQLLERIAQQGEALPLAAASLQKTVAGLQSLETSWTRAHAQALELTTRAHAEAAAQAGRAHAEAADQASRAHASSAEHASRAHASSAEQASRAHVEAAERIGRALEDATRQSSRAHAEAAEKTTKALEGAALVMRTETTATIERSAKAASAVFAPLMEGAAETTRTATAAHLEQLRRELEADRDARRSRDAAAATQAEGDRARIFATETARAEQLAEYWSLATDAVRDAMDSARAAFTEARQVEAAQGEARDRVARAVTETAAATLDAATRRMAQAAEADEARGAALGRLSEATEAQTAGLVAVSRTHLEAVESLLTKTIARADAREEKAREEHFAVVAELGAARLANDARAAALEEKAREEHFAVIAELGAARLANDARAVALEEELARAHASYAENLAARLGQHADADRARAAEALAVVKDAASLVHAGGAELGAVAQMFASAVDRHREAAAEWLRSLGAVEAAVEQAGESVATRGLGEQLDRARELFDVQLQFHRELLVQLRGAGVRAEALASVRGGELERERRVTDAST